MPAALNNTTTKADYVGGPSLGGGSLYGRGQLLIANNPASVLITSAREFGSERQTEYPYVTPTLLPLTSGVPTPANPRPERIIQVQIKDATPGIHAQVSGWLIEPDLAGLDVGSAFTSQVSASGSVTPGLGSVQVQHNGVLVSTEPILDFLDGDLTWAVADDPGNTRVTVSGSNGGMPAARVMRSLAQSIPNGLGSVTPIVFDTVQRNNGGLWAGANPTRLTAEEAGFYLVVGGFRWQLSAAGSDRIAILQVNGGAIARENYSVSSLDNLESTISTLWEFAAGDFVELAFSQNSGGALNIEAFSWSPFLSMVKVG